MKLGWSDGSRVSAIVIPNSKTFFITNFKNHLKYKILKKRLNNIKMCLLEREKRKKNVTWKLL